MLIAPDTGNTNTFMIPLSYFCLFIAIVLIPLVYGYIMTKSIGKIHRKRFSTKWGQLYFDARTRSKVSLIHFVFFVFRRQIYVLIAFRMIGFGSM